jgi:tetratricopeptide (TPR) repeat protein
LLPLCRSLATIPDGAPLDSRTDMQISDMALHYVPEITQNLVNLVEQTLRAPSPESDDLTPARVFRHFDERLGAGETLERAKRLDREGKETEAGAEFRAAWEQTPADFDVLYAFGEYLSRRGNFEAASELLRKASEQQPFSCRLMNSLAAALRGTNRHQEAIACLEKALEAEPDDHGTYFNLAIALHEAGRPKDAIHRLETALAKWPTFTEARELHQRLSSALRRT